MLRIMRHTAIASKVILGILPSPAMKYREVYIRVLCPLHIHCHSYNTTTSSIVVSDPIPATNPCHPSPCGPYSQCREVNEVAVCTCLINYIGTPPACRPECAASSECPLNKACINQRCQDPCPGTCGQNARCQVTNHNPICSCSPGFAGDPFIRCLREESKLSLVHPI